MLEPTLDQARAIAVVVLVVLLVVAVAAALVMRSIVQKILVAGVVLLLAGFVWTQRASFERCVDDLREAGFRGEATCRFLGRDVRISAGGDAGT